MLHEDVPATNLPVSAELPISIEGVALPQPNPGDPATFISGCCRVLTKPPQYDKRTLRALQRFTRRWCKKNLKPLSPETDLCPVSWLENQPTYSRAQKQKLLRNYRNRMNCRLQKADTRVSGFIKDETYPEEKVPRLINSRSDFFKVFSGPYFQAVSDVVFKHPSFIKTVPVHLRPKVLLDELYTVNGVYHFTDYTSFESHFTKKLMNMVEFVLYRYMASSLSPDLKKHVNEIIMVLQGTNVCRYKFATLDVEAGRMSGEMNTSLGNGFANLMFYLFLAERNKAGAVRGFVEGDDGIFRLEFPENAPTVKDFASIGLTIKIGITDKLEEASFCGCVYDPAELIVVPDVRKVLATFGWTSQRYVRSRPSIKMQLLRAKGLSLAYQYNGVPMLSSFGRRILELTEGVTIKETTLNSFEIHKRDFLSDAMKNLPPEIILPVQSSTRLLVDRLYGIPVSLQLDFEKSMADLQLYSRISLPTMDWPFIWVNNYDLYVGLEKARLASPVDSSTLILLRQKFPKTDFRCLEQAPS